MNPDRVRWGDSRIEEAFKAIHDELHELRPLPERLANVIDEMRAFRRVPERLAEVVVEFRNLRQDVGKCFDAIRDAEMKREAREEQQRKERKADRRWMVATALSAAGIVIAALALLADKL